MKEFRRHINKTDIAALIFMAAVFGISLYAQLSGAGKTKTFTILTGVVLIALAWLILTPIRYEIGEDVLIIDGPWPLKERRIPYEKVLDIDGIGSFLPFKADADAVELVLTVQKEDSDRFKKVSCHPSHAKEFFEELKKRCPNLVEHETMRPKKKDVFQTLMGTDEEDKKKEGSGS